ADTCRHWVCSQGCRTVFDQPEEKAMAASRRWGIVSHAGYLPYRRLDRSGILPVAGAGGGKGTRTVASYDEDTTTMGVEAARLALRPVPGARPAAVYLATTAP